MDGHSYSTSPDDAVFLFSGVERASSWSDSYLHGWIEKGGRRFDVRWHERRCWAAFRDGVRVGGDYDSREAAQKGALSSGTPQKPVRFSAEQLRRIELDLAAGVRHEELARRWGLSPGAMDSIIANFGLDTTAYCACGRKLKPNRQRATRCTSCRTQRASR